jgi:hypothetical protein
MEKKGQEKLVASGGRHKAEGCPLSKTARAIGITLSLLKVGGACGGCTEELVQKISNVKCSFLSFAFLKLSLSSSALERYPNPPGPMAHVS